MASGTDNGNGVQRWIDAHPNTTAYIAVMVTVQFAIQVGQIIKDAVS